MLPACPPREYPVFSAGIDWLTCTAKNGSPALALERVSDSHIADARSNGVNVTNQSWLGFEGYKLEGLFFGRREHDVMLCLSGGLAHDLGPPAIQACTNVSRLDLQVTICSYGEQLQLARDTWRKYKTMDQQRGRPRTFSLIVNHPAGETFYLNSRSSDNFARIYDKGIESQLCPAGLMWRYEVEFKRKVAKRESLDLAPREQLCAAVSDRVHSWMTSKGIDPPWPFGSSYADVATSRAEISTDVLTWYRNSVSISIAKSVKRYGLSAVIENLGLQKLVQPFGGKTNGEL